jgi:CRP-like cAMP-binding protein
VAFDGITKRLARPLSRKAVRGGPAVSKRTAGCIGGNVVELCGPNEALGFMSVIDGSFRTSTARVKETAELSVIDAHKFRFMVDRYRTLRCISWK